MRITKSKGLTRTEQLLSELCDNTFLKLWSYPNPYKADSKELCDLLAVFENHVFLFFDRESRKFDKSSDDTLLTWERWEREAVQRQIATARKAEKYVSQHPDRIYLDPRQIRPLPIKLPLKGYQIHKIIVAHGAKEACEQFSEQNVSGSLAIAYGKVGDSFRFPFMVSLDKDNPVHLFDSHNLRIIFSELDTFYDFVSYLKAKEQAIRQFDCLFYCGEEDLLAHYFLNFDGQAHFIGTKDKTINGVFIGEGEWKDFIKSGPYQRRKQANEVSYLWDELIQRTCQNALDERLLGNVNPFDARNAIYEMTKEPRFSRRALSDAMTNSIEGFPYDRPGIVRNVSLMPSFYPRKAYVFLQIRHPNIVDYENEYRPVRSKMLQIACGAAKNKFPDLNKIIGIAIDAPKFAKRNSEDFVLLNCETWPPGDAAFYEEANTALRFFSTDSMRVENKTVSNFPPAASIAAAG
jgi:hypothetical protein